MTATPSQTAAIESMLAAIFDPETHYMTLSGPAGSGKTFIVNELISQCKEMAAIAYQFDINWSVTATTNKAAAVLQEALYEAGNRDIEVTTLAKRLGVRVDNKSRKLVANASPKSVQASFQNAVLIIDESSFLNEDTLQYVEAYADKALLVIFVGDRYQLPPVSGTNNVFDTTFCPQIELTEIKRQDADSNIAKASKHARESVASGLMPTFELDDRELVWLPKEDFVKSYLHDLLNQPSNSVRLLAWANDTVEYYNKLGIQAFTGRTEMVAGDSVICNSFHLNKQGRFNVPTDATVRITQVQPWEEDERKIMSRIIETNYGNLRQAQSYSDVHTPTNWLYDYVDLRFTFASTVNKAQGSAFDTVYIDLSDIDRTKSFNLKLRLVYVAISRARKKVVFTGDISQC